MLYADLISFFVTRKCQENENENPVVKTLLFGRADFCYSTNKEIINATISFILTTERFNCPLF